MSIELFMLQVPDVNLSEVNVKLQQLINVMADHARKQLEEIIGPTPLRAWYEGQFLLVTREQGGCLETVEIGPPIITLTDGKPGLKTLEIKRTVKIREIEEIELWPS